MTDARLAPPSPAVARADKRCIAEALEETRVRTWLLADAIADDDLARPVLPILSPPTWDLAHMANVEELWLGQKVGECCQLHEGYNELYDAMKTPRRVRAGLELLDRAGVRAYSQEVRRQTLEVLASVDLETQEPLTCAGFVYWLTILHEQQHQETLLQTINLLGPERYQPAQVRALPKPNSAHHARHDSPWCTIASGSFQMGCAPGPGVYDNESRPHEVHVPAFEMARYPVTCGQYLEFMEAGGYDDASLWTGQGRRWLDEEPHHAPLNWEQSPSQEWVRRSPAGRQPIAAIGGEILCHVSAHEADAYAKWRGCRLPTEAEWEKAARWNPETGQVAGRNPWGDQPANVQRANIDQLAWHPSRVGAYPQGAAPSGCQQMIGDVWEWTSSTFQPYPGFQAFPYPEYSKVFFGPNYRVLRGGAWSTRAGCANATFRNWDFPTRRQIFSGIRLARDV